MRLTTFRRLAAVFSMIPVLGMPLSSRAQEAAIPLWPGPPPGSEERRSDSTGEATDFNGGSVICNVFVPTLTPYLPDADKANGTAVIICPGGGFRILAVDHEGTQVARWLNERGVAAFVLRYRLVDTGPSGEDLNRSMMKLVSAVTKHTDASDKYAALTEDPDTMRIVPLAVADGIRAMRIVRERAAEWNIAPDRIGIMGFSAGAGVTTGVVLESDAQTRPDFAAPIYGGILSEAPVPDDAPPVFVLAANDDPLAGSSIRIASDWKAARRPVELHIYAKGGHGFGMRKQDLPVDGWIDRFGEWLESLGLMQSP